MQKIRNLWIDYLRSTITVLVLAHHAALAYMPWNYFDPIAYIRSTHAVVDQHVSVAVSRFVIFNDVYFMSLMFIISGLFTLKSLRSKGVSTFLRDRLLRLFVPFIVLGTLFMLIAYLPSYYLAHGSVNFMKYVRDFFLVEQWPAGPPWFLWVLFIFNAIVALLFAMFRSIVRVPGFPATPFALTMLVIFLTWFAYVPITTLRGESWIGFYPFDVQLNRVFLYFLYFILGVLLQPLLVSDNPVSAKTFPFSWWWIWLIAGFVGFLTFVSFDNILFSIGGSDVSMPVKQTIKNSLFAVTCACLCLGLTAIFNIACKRELRWWNSLSENAYMIYLVHFVFVTWSQFLLLPLELHGWMKFLISFVVSLSFSWCLSIVLRRVKIIRTYV